LGHIEGVPEEKANPLVRAAYRYSRRRMGRVVEPLAVAAHHPWVFMGSSTFEFCVERSKLVDPRLKELAALKAATLVGCPW
jgi:hypothetical protein